MVPLKRTDPIFINYRPMVASLILILMKRMILVMALKILRQILTQTVVGLWATILPISLINIHRLEKWVGALNYYRIMAVAQGLTM